MATDIMNNIKLCLTCLKCKVVTRTHLGLLLPLPIPEYCLLHRTMDLITCLPKTDHGVDAIATFIDRLSKYTYFVPIITSISADNFALVFLLTVVASYIVPERLIYDRDPHFVSVFWKGLISDLGAYLALSTAYHTQADGLSELLHQALELILRYFVFPRLHDWDILLHYTKLALNGSSSSWIGFTSAYMLYGHEPNLPLEVAVHNITDNRMASVSECVACISDIVLSFRKTFALTIDSIVMYTNHKHRDINLCMGDLALLSTKHLRLPSNLSRKFAPRFVGPFKVIEAVTPV